MSKQTSEETKEFANIDYTNTSAYLTVQAFKKEGITWMVGEAPPGFSNTGIPENDFGQLQGLRRLDSIVKPDKGPILKVIRSMHRQLVSEFDEFGKPVKKEYLTLNGGFRGMNWVGEEFSYEFVEGTYKQPVLKKTYKGSVKFDSATGADLGKMTVTSTKPTYTMELPKDKAARKKYIDNIIDNAKGTHSESVLYYYKDTVGGFRDATFSHIQFTELSIDELRDTSKRGGGERGGPGYYRDKDNNLRRSDDTLVK